MSLVRERMTKAIIENKISDEKIVGYGSWKIGGLVFHTILNVSLFYLTTSYIKSLIF